MPDKNISLSKEDGFHTSAEIAYNIISKKILSGEFAPGMKLSRRKMAEATGVSVIPVIEALKKLEEDNLVESKPQWGSFVTVPTLEKVKQVYQFREAIECQTARIVSQTMTAEQRAVLSEIATILDTTPYSPETVDEMQEMHFQFHTKLTEFSCNPLLEDALRKINLFWLLCKALREKRPQVTVPRYWHMRLIDVIAEGDSQKAEEMMREHILDSFYPIIENWGKN